MKIIKKLVPLGFLALPFAAMADNAQSLSSLITLISNLLGRLVPLFIGIAAVILLFAIIQYVRAGEDEEKRKSARSLMIYGIIGLFVMVSLWGLVNFLVSTLGLDVGIPVHNIIPPQL